MAVDRKSVLLGSGVLYLMPFAGEMPEDAALEAEDNALGRIKGGASLEYKPEEYEVEDDMGEVVVRFITKEEAMFKSGVLTWALENLAKLSPGVYTHDETGGEKKLVIGGAKSLTDYALRFVHTKADGNKLRITMVATAGSGFTLTFEGKKETVIDAEFKALSQDDGTLVEIREQVPAVGGGEE